MTTTALLCESCGTPCPTGTATVRTTLTPAGLTPVAWCRTCRPVVPSIPSQRVGGSEQ